MIIGIAGTLGAGKGTVVEYLKKKGFRHYSSSGVIRDEILSRGMAVDRDSMNAVGNDLRQKNGSGYLVAFNMGRASKEEGNSVLEAIQSLGEAEEIRKNGGVLWAVDADPQIRYARIQERKSEKDQVTFEKFIEQEKLETESNDYNKQNIGAVMAMADTVFINNSTPEELFAQVEEALQKIK
ncbi:MAG TPA: AAA family ATPase [Candidatus Paceibacterota bacterium]|nr:AAA family ATPase [Candidatus Paceibacterota bacterium]